jgi:micrococcal nuclease
MPEQAQTTTAAVVVTVTDGDTIRVTLPEADNREETLRILALDTEECHNDSDRSQKEIYKGGKPITNLGNRAKERARDLLSKGDSITLIFPDNSPIETAFDKHRGNYGRLLCYVELNDKRDFQEIMIREGWSPYMSKYGYAQPAERHFTYIRAEALAQAESRGIWSYRVFNGERFRRYERLLPWWHLRARVIETFRAYQTQDPQSKILNSRIDYEEICSKAEQEENTTIFTELRQMTLLDSEKAIVTSGSGKQPFKLFIPAMYSWEGQKILRLLEHRYLTTGYDGSTVEKGGTNYAYVKGPLKLYNGEPEITITKACQITDAPPQQR